MTNSGDVVAQTGNLTLCYSLSGWQLPNNQTTNTARGSYSSWSSFVSRIVWEAFCTYAFWLLFPTPRTCHHRPTNARHYAHAMKTAVHT